MITYLELLQMVKEGNAPNRIAFEGILFERGDSVYRCPLNDRKLSCFLWGSGEVYQALEKCIEILGDDEYYEEDEEILKDAECYEGKKENDVFTVTNGFVFD